MTIRSPSATADRCRAHATPAARASADQVLDAPRRAIARASARARAGRPRPTRSSRAAGRPPAADRGGRPARPDSSRQRACWPASPAKLRVSVIEFAEARMVLQDHRRALGESGICRPQRARAVGQQTAAQASRKTSRSSRHACSARIRTARVTSVIAMTIAAVAAAMLTPVRRLRFSRSRPRSSPRRPARRHF